MALQKLNTALYYEIAELIANGECVLFLGAGASRGEKGENGLPGADELASKLWDKIKNYRVPLNGLDRKSLLKVAHWYEIIKGKSELDKFIKDEFEKINEPLRLHKCISGLPFKFIITTNYDRLLEIQLEHRKTSFYCIVDDKDIKHWDEQKTIILKIHGCISKSKELVVTEDDYIKFLSAHSPFHEILKTLFFTKNILFVGYSLSDINIKLVLQLVTNVMGQGNKKHYLIQRSNINDDIRSYWSTKDIKVFNSSATDFIENVAEAFESLDMEKKVGRKFDFYIDNYRLDALELIRKKVLERFSKDIEDEWVGTDDYRFREQIYKAFRNEENQKTLVDLIKRDKGIFIILDILSKMPALSTSQDIFTQLKDLLRRTTNQELQELINNYLHKNNMLSEIEVLDENI